MSVSFKLKMSLYSSIPLKFTDAKVVKALLLVNEKAFSSLMEVLPG